MPSKSYDLVRKAIVEKLQVIARYNGYKREMCPHTLGLKKGNEHALFYQFGGESSSGLAPIGSPENWRCVAIDKLEDIELRKGEWYSAANHSQSQTCVDDVDVEVSY